ncbi:MAG: hypothetical protein N4A46_14650 [Schleiferiaceae bacterium]|jgi:hypothetical protein|nr:hypothetical protein [Schleiferiaceae bacterium]
MKTKFRISIYFLPAIIFSFFGSLFFVSCQKDEPVTKKQSFDYEQIGIEHNKGLDYIFEYLKKEGVNKNSKLKNSTEIFELTKQATLSFAKASTITKDVDFNKLPLTFKSFNRNTLKSAGTNDIVTSIQSEINLSPLQITYLNQLDEIMSNVKIGLQPTIEEVKKLELDIIENCSSEDSDILLSSTSVARHSLEYWTVNCEKWLNELGGINTSNVKYGDWFWFIETLIVMGKSDVVGAAIGAGVGALAGGVGALPGAIAGACYSSAGRGIVALLDYWGIW